MDPMTLSAIMGGGSAVLGMIEGNNAQKLQARIARENLEMQKQAANRQWQIAQKTMEMQQAGSRDAEGNQTQYIPGVGWVTTASDTTKGVIDASRAEQFKRLTEDASMGRQNLRDDFARRGKEGAMADATMTEWKADNTPDTNTLRHAILRNKMSGLDRGFDQESQNSMRQANRSGASNAGNIIASLASRRADANSDARSSSYLDALTARESMQGSRDTRLGNKYNMLAGRATGSQPNFMPDSTSDSLRSALQSRMNTNAQAMGVAGNLAGNAPQMDSSHAKPKFGAALALGGLADLVGTFKSWDSGGGDKGNGYGVATRAPTSILPRDY